jgi:hypothetical protein
VRQVKVTDVKALYAELKPVMEVVATPLFDFSKKCIYERGDFLPHAAVLNADDKVALVGAQGEHEVTNAAEILPLLHGGLRALAKQKNCSAIGVAESVTITLPGQAATKAIKVLFEHRRGLTASLYVPYEKKLLRGYVFGAMFSMLAKPEVNAWQDA